MRRIDLNDIRGDIVSCVKNQIHAHQVLVENQSEVSFAPMEMGI
jgi:hypothetical protein